MFENPSNELEGKEAEKQELVALARELSERGETFPFPEIEPDAYARMKAGDEEFPGFTTPVDEIIARCRLEGIKVALGKYPESGNVFILPAQSNDIENDSFAPKQLQMTDAMDESLRKLVELDRG